MWQPLFYVLPLALSTLAIRVPVDGKDENSTTESVTVDKKLDTYYVSDEAAVDSYLIPPDPHRPAEVLADGATPATYLLPPAAEKQIDYYAPTEADQQSDWYPIAPVPIHSTPVVLLPPQHADVIPIFLPNNRSYDEKTRSGKAFSGKRIAIPSRQLEPPFESLHGESVISKPADRLELPSTEINQAFNVPTPVYQAHVLKPLKHKNLKKNLLRAKAKPTLATHLTPPRPDAAEKYKIPTKLYPKKVSKGFQPIPIPISEFAPETTPEVPRAKPAKPFKPAPGDETVYCTPSDDKDVYQYQQAQKKRKLKEQNGQQLAAVAPEDTYGVNAPVEQETSETNYRHPGRNVYPAPLRQAPPPPPPAAPQKNGPAPPAPDERTEFRMHGMKGPHSYQFGFDTGKGKNRQFRYEERDDDGRVKGHYGYMDKNGKMRVVNYKADPETGFHAEAPSEAPA